MILGLLIAFAVSCTVASAYLAMSSQSDRRWMRGIPYLLVAVALLALHNSLDLWPRVGIVLGVFIVSTVIFSHLIEGRKNRVQ